MSTTVRHSTSSPDALKMIAPRAADVAADPSCPGGDDPGPADDGEERENHQHLPADVGPYAAGKGDWQRLAVRAEMAGDPAYDHPLQDRLHHDADQLQIIVGLLDIDQQTERDEHVPDIADLAR